MRILLVSDCFAPRLGGIESQVHDLAQVLQGKGHEVLVVTATPTKPHSAPELEIVDGIRILRLTSRLIGSTPINPFAGPRLRTLFASADVVHIHTGVISPFAQHAIMIAGALRVPTSVTWHCMLGPWWPLFHVVRFAQWAAARGVTMNAVSSQLAPAVQRIVGKRTKVHVLHNGMDPSDWADIARRRLARAQATEHSGVGHPQWTDETATSPAAMPVRIVASRRLEPRKRNDVLIRLAVDAQKQAGVPVELTIFGEGAERKELEALVRRLGAPWIKLPGRVDRAALRQAYEEADIYFSTALMESFGIATLEGRTAGLPVVAPDKTGVVDFCEHGVDGFLGDGDAALRDCLARMIADTQTREKIARHNAENLPPQNWDTIAQATLAEYQRARRAQGL